MISPMPEDLTTIESCPPMTFFTSKRYIRARSESCLASRTTDYALFTKLQRMPLVMTSYHELAMAAMELISLFPQSSASSWVQLAQVPDKQIIH